jgi:hypothetical protein
MKPLVSFATKFEASDSKATKRPSELIVGPALQLSAWASELLTLTRVVSWADPLQLPAIQPTSAKATATLNTSHATELWVFLKVFLRVIIIISNPLPISQNSLSTL